MRMPYPLSPCSSSYTPTTELKAFPTFEKASLIPICETGSTVRYFLHPTVASTNIDAETNFILFKNGDFIFSIEKLETKVYSKHPRSRSRVAGEINTGS